MPASHYAFDLYVTWLASLPGRCNLSEQALIADGRHRVSGLTNAWVASGHCRTGILMAPVNGKLLATWITDGAAPPLAAPLVARLASP